MANKSQQNQEVKRIKKFLAHQFKKQQSRGVGLWNITRVQNVIDQQCIGDFSGTSELARKMMTDEAYSSAMKKRVQALIRSEFSFQPANESLEAKVVADSLLKVWFEHIPELVISRLLESFLATGVALAWVSWPVVDGIRVPCIDVYDTEFLRFDQNTCKWLYRTANGEMEVNPGDGNWLLISEWAPGLVKGYASNLGSVWFAKQLARKDWQAGNSAHIDTIAIIKDDGQGQTVQEDIDALAAEIQDKKQDRVFYAAPGQDIRFQEAIVGYNPTAFSEVIRDADKCFQIAILGGNLSSDVSGVGSYAAAEVHAGVATNYTTTDAQVFSTELRKQLINHMTYALFGEHAIKLAPWPHWQTVDGEDLMQLSTVLNGFKQVLGDEWEIANMVALAERFGISIKKKEPILK